MNNQVIPIICDTETEQNLHPCPYKVDLHGDYELCECDEEQMNNCLVDI